MDQEFFTTEEVAVWLKVARKTVRRWIRKGKLPASKPGKEYRVPKEAVIAMLENRGGVSSFASRIQRDHPLAF